MDCKCISETKRVDAANYCFKDVTGNQHALTIAPLRKILNHKVVLPATRKFVNKVRTSQRVLAIVNTTHPTQEKQTALEGPPTKKKLDYNTTPTNKSTPGATSDSTIDYTLA